MPMAAFSNGSATRTTNSGVSGHSPVMTQSARRRKVREKSIRNNIVSGEKVYRGTLSLSKFVQSLMQNAKVEIE
jgi:hypothetical protein